VSRVAYYEKIKKYNQLISDREYNPAFFLDKEFEELQKELWQSTSRMLYLLSFDIQNEYVYNSFKPSLIDMSKLYAAKNRLQNILNCLEGEGCEIENYEGAYYCRKNRLEILILVVVIICIIFAWKGWFYEIF